MKERYKIKKLYIFLILFLVLLLSCTNIKRFNNRYIIKQISVSNEKLCDNGNSTKLLIALNESIDYLSAHPNKVFIFNYKPIKAIKLKHSLIKLKLLVKQHKKLCLSDLKKYFYIYTISKNEGWLESIIDFLLNRNKNKNKVLITGYFEPILQASYRKTEEFKVPIYAPPSDLVQVYLPLFDKTLPNKSLWGRIYNGRLIPYFTREEIEKRIKEKKLNAKAIAWLKSPIDLLVLQIQGSAILDIDGTKRFIHYAASNGRPYVSIGRILLDKGILSFNKLSWQSIREWAKENPEIFSKILKKNPRYIFFKWEKNGPLGSLGLPLVPMRTIAMDHTIYPSFLIVFVTIKTKTKRMNLITINFDQGAAIKGYRRIDLYCGSGKAAGALAGSLKCYSKVYFLVPK